MELEEIQATWAQMTEKLEKQERLTYKIILQMTQQKYSGKFSKLSTYETIGAVICFAVAIFILINFAKLDTWYLIACGVFTLAVLLVMPVVVLRYLGQIKRLNITEGNYTQTFVRFTKARKKLLAVQQFSIYISFILMFAVAAVFSKILSNDDFFTKERDGSVYVAIAVALIFVFFTARWGYRSYKKVTSSAENILKELE